MSDEPRPLIDILASYRPEGPVEAADVERMRDLVQTAQDPWSQSLPLHVTASALIVHPDSRQVLLRWHERQQGWLQVGGHGDPGESDPVQVALREGKEETSLGDLTPWPDAELVHAVIVPVAARGDDPAHEHADLRFVLATSSPETARPERPSAPLRWLSIAEARDVVQETNLLETLSRTEKVLAG
ncbi:NUDIX hydrolase [Phytoactinopolyspora mesophila]|uniref:NUDIX domain-containing protein n=1 Tax=Phytoactinopolyspora mesophila TaxID=2650750 RepID=A0A7K3LY05_9ACTN|nr:NUDIX domain-containing protein [Phytoactinopolyspora mesophila]NDL55914.1 NUDIX domain-containing protein [Phytoactinopolyspora mesophila]